MSAKNSQKIGSRLRFYSEIRQALEILHVIDYSVITGGFVQSDMKLGDVDIITVLPCLRCNNVSTFLLDTFKK